MKCRNPNAEEKRYMNRVGSLGCIVCLLNGIETDATIHHCDGRTKKDAHFKILPLCGAHHQIACPVGSWATRHPPGRNAGRAAFEEAYGTEEELMAKVEELLCD